VVARGVFVMSGPDAETQRVRADSARIGHHVGVRPLFSEIGSVT